MDFKFNLNGQAITVKNARVCADFFSKMRGLMFRANPKPLIFIFKKPNLMRIHSFFVFQKFLAVWMLHGKVIDAKIIKPWRISVAPKQKFDTLLELPLTTSSGFLESSNLDIFDTIKK